MANAVNVRRSVHDNELNSTDGTMFFPGKHPSSPAIGGGGGTSKQASKTRKKSGLGKRRQGRKRGR